jgi:hypothetical protein
MKALGPRGAVDQAGGPAATVTRQTLGDGAWADPKGRCCVLGVQPILEHGSDHLPSTQWRENIILRNVHGVERV